MPLSRSSRGRRATASLRRLTVIVGAVAVVALAAALPIADQRIPASPPEQSETTSAPTSGRIIAIDETTGEFRAPTPKELSDLHRNSTGYKTNDLPPVERLSDGSRRQRLDRQVRSASYARIEDGELTTECGEVTSTAGQGDLR